MLIPESVHKTNKIQERFQSVTDYLEQTKRWINRRIQHKILLSIGYKNSWGRGVKLYARYAQQKIQAKRAC